MAHINNGHGFRIGSTLGTALKYKKRNAYIHPYWSLSKPNIDIPQNPASISLSVIHLILRYGSFHVLSHSLILTIARAI